MRRISTGGRQPARIRPAIHQRHVSKRALWWLTLALIGMAVVAHADAISWRLLLALDEAEQWLPQMLAGLGV